MRIFNSLPPVVKKVISVAFFASLVLFGARICSVESASCELVFRLGASLDEPGEVARELEVRLYELDNNELLGNFRKYFPTDSGKGPDARWPLTVSEGTYRLEGELTSDLKVRSFARQITIGDEDVIIVYVDRALIRDAER